MLPNGDGRCELFFDQKSSQRDSCGDGLGDGDDVGCDAESLEGEDGTGAAEAALNLIENQRGVIAVGKGAALLQKFNGAFVDSAFAENWFEDNRAGVVVHCSTEGLHVVAWDKLHVLQQRFETFAVLVLPGDGHGSEAASVIGTFEGDQLAFDGASDAVSGETS